MSAPTLPRYIVRPRGDRFELVDSVDGRVADELRTRRAAQLKAKRWNHAIAGLRKQLKVAR